VLDCLAGYLVLAERLLVERERCAGAWNFGPSMRDFLTVRELVERIAAKWPQRAGWRHDPGDHPHEAAMLRLDTSKSTQLLDWQPRLGSAEAVDWIVEWYTRYFGGTPAAELCSEQFDRFEALRRDSA